MKRIYWIMAALAFVLLTAGTMVLRWQQGPGAPEARPQPADIAHAAVEGDLFNHYLIEAPKKAVQAETFQAVPINGGPPGLAGFQGRYLLLNFWATWCEPCKVEMPELQALHEGLKDRNVAVVAISMQEEPDKVRKFLATTPYTFHVYADPEGKVAELYGVTSIPLTYLIRPDGRIEGRALGLRTWNDKALRDHFVKEAAQR